MILKLTKEPKQQSSSIPPFCFFSLGGKSKHACASSPERYRSQQSSVHTRTIRIFLGSFGSVPLLDHLFEGSSFWTVSKQIRTDPVWTQPLSVPVSGTTYSGSEQFRSSVNGALTFANDKKIRRRTTPFNTIYLCLYIFIVLIEYQGWSI